MLVALVALLHTDALAGGAGIAGIPGVSAAIPAAAPSVAAWAATLEADVVSAPTWAARRERVTAALGTADGDRAGRLGQTLAVLASLERTGRTDPSVVRLFVRATLADDPAVRAAAVDAASRNGDPPLVAAAPAAPAAAASMPAGTVYGGRLPLPTSVGPAPLQGAASPASPAPAGAASAPAPAAPAASAPAASAPAPSPTARIPGFDAALPAPAAPPAPAAAPGIAPVSDHAAAPGIAPAPGHAAPDATLTPAATPPTASAPPALETLRAYKARRLVRSGTTRFGSYPVAVGNTYTSVMYSSEGWKVSDGGGAPFTGEAFARLTGDGAKLREYDKRITTGWVWMAGLGFAGTVMLGALAPRLDDPMDGGAAFLMLGGAAALGTCWLPPVMAHRYRGAIDNSYTPAEADRRIEAYNGKLREELGLSEADVRDIDLGARAPIGPTIALLPTGIYGTF